MKIALKDLQPNPFRDFKIDPVDDDHVRELTRSIKANDFWGGVVVRRGKDGHEVAAGWHRIKAAEKAGVAEADFAVRPLDDDAMRSVYAWENATQRGNTSTALAGCIAMAIRAIAKEDFTREVASENRGGHNRDGIGQDRILARLTDVPGITEHVIRQQLANLKASGDYDRIVREETGSELERKHEVTFDITVGKHLKSPSHVETFRKLATSEQGRKFLPVKKQAELAKTLAKKAEAEDRELTSDYLRTSFDEALTEPRFIQRTISQSERASRQKDLEQAGWRKNMEVQMRVFSGAARGANAAASKIVDLHRNRPKGASLMATSEFRNAIELLKAALRMIEGKLL